MTLLWLSNTYILPRIGFVSKFWMSKMMEPLRLKYEAKILQNIVQNSSKHFDKESVVSRWKEGGMYLRIKEAPPNLAPAPSVQSAGSPSVLPSESLATTFSRSRKTPVKSKPSAWFSQQQQVVESLNVEEALQSINKAHLERAVTAHKVVGRPFLEDMSSMLPSRILKANVTANTLKDETLYYIMRSFGRIKSMEPKDGGFLITFNSIRDAISARNCLNNSLIENATVQLQFVEEAFFPFFAKIWNVLTHFKLSIPLIFVATSISLYFLISPIRLFNVTEKLTMNWSDPAEPLKAVFSRSKEEDYLKKRLSSRPSSVLIICGPHQSGKTTLLRNVIDKREFAVRIDCQALQNSSKSGNEHFFIDNLSESVGFKPSFSSFNTIISYIESALMIKQSTIKTNREIQLGAVLDMLTSALNVISQLYPRDHTKNFKYSVIVFDGFEELINSIEKGSSEFDKGTSLIDMLLNFAYQVNEIQKNAHVVFVTSTAYGEEKLKNHPILRGKVDTLNVEDLSYNDTNLFLSNLSESEREKMYKTLGGRVQDLHSIQDRVSRGIHPMEAVQSMIQEAKSDLIFKAQNAGTKYSQSQLWKTINLFSKVDQVDYKQVVSNIFLGDEEPLNKLVLDSILRVVSVQKEDGTYEKIVKPFSPLVHEAIRVLSSDEVFAQRIQISIFRSNIKKYQEEILVIVQELFNLSESKINDKSIENRKNFLMNRLNYLNGRQSNEQSMLDVLENKK